MNTDLPGPCFSFVTAELIDDFGKSVQDFRRENQRREDLALLELSKKPGFEWLANQIPKRNP
jgi:hypothetical protein